MNYNEYSDQNTSLKNRRILIVDDHRNIRVTVKLSLEAEGAEVIEAESYQQAAALIGAEASAQNIHCFLLDIRLPDGNGIDLLKLLADKKHASRTIMISGEGTMTEAFKATQLGAFDYIEKPFTPERLIVSARRCMDFNFLKEENQELQKKVATKNGEIIGSHPNVQKLLQTIRKIAPTQSRTLIFGESGTGKELVARAIHSGSTRAQKPMIKVNCAAIPQSLMESELFGHEKGAFTGAIKQRRGLFEQADGGTLFLDEIGELSLDVQSKLLRVLQNGEIQRIGSEKTIAVDVRVLAATHRNLQEMVADGTFREDLFYRLNVVNIDVPPLRERISDIPLLVAAFVEETTKEHATGPKSFSRDAMSQLMSYSWPGNIRQLRNIIEKSVILASTDVIEEIEGLPKSNEVREIMQNDTTDHVALDSFAINNQPTALLDQENASDTVHATPTSQVHEFQWSGPIKTWESFHEEIDRAYISLVLQKAKGNVSEAARILCLERAYLHRLMKRHNINRDVVIA